MGLLDYHGKNLLPSVWDRDDRITQKFLAQVQEQLRRFPETTDVLLVGDATSHYWKDDSDIDVVLLVPKPYLRRYADLAAGSSGFRMAGTQNPVKFWVLPKTVAPTTLRRHFGSVYVIATERWLDQPLYGQSELLRPSTLLQRANWKLYKAKNTDDPFPYEWKILAAAYNEMAAPDRAAVLDALGRRVKKLDASVSRLLTAQPRDVWEASTNFEEELIKTQLLPDHRSLPDYITKAILNQYRFQDLYETLEEIDNTIRSRQKSMEVYETMRSGSTMNFEALNQRILRSVDFLIQKAGGYKVSQDVMFDVISYLLQNSRFFVSDIKRRQIAQRIYNRYYRGGE